ncbi:MAG: methyltransferase domain-containing protein [Deltaproteobacteria bacterium]|nr:methyltransferase domain-containing protein [Myxococcales bacterium]MDP3218539.1 methyltransferase domain-containing protein [Deltaproteobacteria bacterium]
METPAATFRFEDLFDPAEYLHFLADTLRAEDTDAQVDFAVRALGLMPGAPVVDLGCGHGRHSIALARRGHPVVGVDLVEGFVTMAREAAAREGLVAEFVHGDLRSFTVAPPAFDGAVCLFDAFGWFDDDDQLRILRNVFAMLRPGARLLLDLRTREFVTRLAPVSVTDAPGGDLMVDRHRFDLESGRLIDTRTTVRDGRTRTVTFSVRVYAYTEIRLMLRAVGFEVERVYGGFDGAPLSALRPRTLVVARRP